MSNGSRIGDMSPAGSIALGIVVGLASTCIQSVGLTLQRKSHLLEDEKHNKYVKPHDSEAGNGDIREFSPYRPAYRRRRWQIGMALFIISNLVGSTIQITTLPLPVLSTLQASGLVFNTLCASLILSEPFTRWSFIGTALIAGGALLIALFGSVAEPSHTLSQLLELLGRQQFLLWMMGTILIIGAILIAVFVLGRVNKHGHSHRVRVARGFAFGGISGILSAHSLLVAKSAVELLVRTIVDKSNQFNRWESWVILLSLVFFALTQLYFLHRGLKLVSTSILYPFVFCIYNIIAILDGLIYFKQTSRLSSLHSGLIALGTFVLLSGVLALSWRMDETGESAPPPDAHTLLTPGFGIVEDTTTEDERDTDIDEDNASITSADEELGLQPSEVTPLLSNGRASAKRKVDSLLVSKSRRHVHIDEPSSPNGTDPLPPTDKLPSTEAIQNPLRTSLPASMHPIQKLKHHRRVQSADVHSPPSRHSSPSPSSSPHPLLGGLSRASTVHASSDFRGPVHSLTWRERDREMRRQRRWVRPRRNTTAAVGEMAPERRGRSVSTPLAPSSRRRRSRAGTDALPPRDAGVGGDGADEARPARRVGSLGHWVGRLFSVGRSKPPDDDAQEQDQDR